MDREKELLEFTKWLSKATYIHSPKHLVKAYMKKRPQPST